MIRYRLNENSVPTRLDFDEATPFEISNLLRLDDEVSNADNLKVWWTQQCLGDWDFLVYAIKKDNQSELYFTALNVELNHSRFRNGEIYYVRDLKRIDDLNKVANDIWKALCQQESISGLDRRDIEYILRNYRMHNYKSSYPWHI